MTYSAGAMTKCFYAILISLLSLSEELKDRLSLSPGFSPVIRPVSDQETVSTVSSSEVSVSNAQQISAVLEEDETVRNGSTKLFVPLITGLKPGVNERWNCTVN
jgi:hypothetical protein